MNEKGYNGYENYETWAVSLWLNNEYGEYCHWTARAEEIKEDAEDEYEEGDTFTAEEVARGRLADEIKEAVEGGNPLADSASLYSDLMGKALGNVDWYEVAESFLEE